VISKLFQIISEPLQVYPSRSMIRRAKFLNVATFITALNNCSLLVWFASIAMQTQSPKDTAFAFVFVLSAISSILAWMFSKRGKLTIGALIFTVCTHANVIYSSYFDFMPNGSLLGTNFLLIPMVFAFVIVDAKAVAWFAAMTVASTLVSLSVAGVFGYPMLFEVMFIGTISVMLLIASRLREIDDSDMREETQNFIHASRLNEIAEQATTLGHEIKNKLSIISGATERLARILNGENGSKNAVAERLISTVTMASEEMNAVLEGMRKMSRGEGMERSNIALSQIRNDLNLLCSHRGKLKGVAIKFGSEFDGSQLILVFGTQLKQALSNLIDNGIDASIASERSLVEVHFRATETDYVFSISDSGKGIVPDERAKVFRSFYTTKPNGNGLGLPVVNRIVALHGGQLKLAPYQDGHGAKFDIEIPKM